MADLGRVETFTTSGRTVDPKEIANYNATARADGAAERARGWLYKYNPVRLAFLQRALGGPLDSDLCVLDAGCGTGIFCEALARTGARVTGVDLASDAIEVAAQTALRDGLQIDYRSVSVGDLPETYDIVATMEVVEHVPDPAAFLALCAARVKPGGLLVVSTINRTWKSFAYAIVMGEYVLRLLPRRSHQWRRFVRPAEIQTVFESLGFETVDTSGVTMNLRTGQLQLSPDDAVNFMLAGRRHH